MSKKWITNNLGLKVLAVLFSIALWLIVININDPVTYKSFSGIEVEILNQAALAEQGKVFEVLENTNVVNVTVNAKRSILDGISKENIRAVADLEDLSSMNTVSIHVSSTAYNDSLDSIKCNTENLKLSIEDLKRTQLVINTVTVGEPSEGYIVGSVATNQNVVRVSGPESAISQISRVEAAVSVEGMSSDISTNVDLRLYNEDGELVDTSNITKNIDSVSVNVGILATKTVPLTIPVTGTPESGFAATGEIVTEPTNITIAGKASVLDSVNDITIPEGSVDITGLRESHTGVVDVGNYLPDGVSFADKSFDGNVTVSVVIEQEVEEIVELPLSSVAVNNLPEGFTAEVTYVSTFGAEDAEAAVIPVTVAGLNAAVSQMTAGNVAASVDITSIMDTYNLEECREGTYQAPLSLTMPEGVRATGSYAVTVTITDNTLEAAE